MKYLKEFILGSSYLVFLPFYYTVYNSQSKKTYSYYQYTLAAPVWFGLWNIISLIIAEKEHVDPNDITLNVYITFSFKVISFDVVAETHSDC